MLMTCTLPVAANTGTTKTTGYRQNKNCERDSPLRDFAAEGCGMNNNTLLERIRAEYVEMQDMQLTLSQAQRLFGLECTLCETVLDALVHEGCLCVKPNGTYGRLADGEILRSAKAALGFERRFATAS
jgi:hypothetical protein